MSITTRQGLIDYCLRKLGMGAIEINVTDEQLEDCMDDALEYFQEFHFDGSEKVYFKHLITGSTVQAASDISSFQQGELVTGTTSGCSFSIDVIDGNTFRTRTLIGTPVVGETVTGMTSGQTTTVVASSIGDTQTHYIDLNDRILGVTRVIPLSSRGYSGGWDMFDLRYQLMLNDFYALTNTEISYYVQVKTHLEQLNQILSPEMSFQWTRSQNRLFINGDWDKIHVGDYIVLEAYAILDPDDWNAIYNLSLIHI
jgi:hypothetical protein